MSAGALVKHASFAVVRAAAALTGSQVASDELSAENWDHVDLYVTWVPDGSSGGVEIAPEVKNLATGEWYPLTEQTAAGSPSSGVVQRTVSTLRYVVPKEITKTVIPVPVRGAHIIRFQVKELGSPGAPSTACALYAAVSRGSAGGSSPTQ